MEDPVSLDVLGLIVGVLSFALGIYQSRRDFKKLSKKLGVAAGSYVKNSSIDGYVKRRVEAMFERADFYIEYPSALLAQYIRSGFGLLMLWGLKMIALDPALSKGLFTDYSALIIKSLFIFLMAKILADTVTISSEIKDRAVYHFRKKRENGEG